MRRVLNGLAALAVLLVASVPAIAQTSATGQALGVDPQAEAEARGESRVLTVGADIFLGDRVITGDAGQVQIMFSDDTKLVVGPRSALLIEDYLVRNDGSAGKLAVNVLNGTFRFVSGNAPKDRYVINTPTGTIGVRGTVIELSVSPETTHFMVTQGSAYGCPHDGGECVDLTNVCEYGTINLASTQHFGHTDAISGPQRDEIKELFQYAWSQSPLMQQFRVADSERCLRRPAPAGGPTSLVSWDGPSSSGSRAPCTECCSDCDPDGDDYPEPHPQ